MSVLLNYSVKPVYEFSFYLLLGMDPVNRNILPSMPCISTPYKPELSESNMVALGRLSPLPLCSSSGFNVQSIASDMPITSNTSLNMSFNTGIQHECSINQTIAIEPLNNLHLRRERSLTPPRLLYENNSFITIKKSSPLKIVSPILKKYSSHRTGKNNKKAVSPKPISTSLDGSDALLLSPTPGSSNSPDLVFFNSSYCFDNDEELSANRATNPPRCPKRKQTPVVNKKKKKQELREVQTMLSLLDPDTDASKEENSLNYAQAFYFFMKDCLETNDNAQLLDDILRIMAEFDVYEMSAALFYERVTALLVNYPLLAEQFLIFLLPEQALECGKFIEHLRITNMHNFVKKLKIFFAKQPQQIRLVFSTLESLSRIENVTAEHVKSLVIPLLKNNTFLIDSLLSLLPDERPPDSLMEEFEDMEVDSDHSGNEEETVDIPEEQDPYGTDHCMCHCHKSSDEKYNTRHQHCVSCGTKFIHGKVYLQTGRSLRPAKISFPGFPNQDHRIYVEVEPKERRRRNTNSPVKVVQTSPNCDESVSEVDDDTKFLSPKSSRTKSKISTSASKVRASIMKCVPDNAGTETDIFKTLTSSSSEQSLISDPPSALDESVIESTSCLPSVSTQESNTTLLSLDSNITVINLSNTMASNTFSTPNFGYEYEEMNNLEMFMSGDIPDESEKCIIIESQYSDVATNFLKMENVDSVGLVTVTEDSSEEYRSVKNETLLEIGKNETATDESKVLGSLNNLPETSMDLNNLFTEPQPVRDCASANLLDRLAESSSRNNADMLLDGYDSASSKIKRTRPPWTKDEDKVILLEVQRGYSVEKTFQNIRGLPQRSLEEIRERFHTLMKMLQEMPLPKEEESSNSSSSTV